MIYTDLTTVPEKPPPNNVEYKRFISAENSVISGAEILNMALMQNSHPNAVDRRYAKSGTYGSKFVTVVMSGNAENEITTFAYQASNQAGELARTSTPEFFLLHSFVYTFHDLTDHLACSFQFADPRSRSACLSIVVAFVLMCICVFI